MTIFSLGVSTAVAQDMGKSNAGNAIRISPVRSSLTISPGGSDSVVLNVQNLTNQAVEYQAIINDFVAGNDELGQPSLILDADKFAPSRRLKRFIAAIPNFTIPGKSAKDIKVSITIPKGTAGGGYYGAVRFAPTTGSDATKNVSLTASVGSLVLVKVPGDIKENLLLESIDVRTSEQASEASGFFTSNKDLYAVVRFKNTGNVHQQPFGRVLLKKGDRVLQAVEINKDYPQANVLPESVRRFSVKLTKVGAWGKYTVEGNFGYGSNGQLLSGKTSFIVVPIMYILIGLLLVGLVIYAIFGLPRAIKRYNAGVIRRANRR